MHFPLELNQKNKLFLLKHTTMKKILFILAFSGTMFTIYSCKKSSSSTTTTVITNADVAGNWEGRYSNNLGSTIYVTMAKFILDANGNATITDSIGVEAILGTYSISGDSIIITVATTLTTTATFRYKLINNKTRMEGKWGASDGSVSGLIYEDKKSSVVVSNANVAGVYFGRYSLSPSVVYTTAAIFHLDASGNTTLTDSIGGSVFTGTYTLSGDSLITTVTGASVVNFRFKISKADGRWDGKWTNMSVVASGLIYEDRR